MDLPHGSPRAFEGDFAGARFLIVEARFYETIAELLRAGAKTAFEKARAAYEIVSVPGALEIPLAMAIVLDIAEAKKRPFDGAIALGCVIRGETYHFEIVANESARALMQLALDRKLALGNGILTVDSEAQALFRADPSKGDKGGHAARAALALLALKHKLGTG
jgi:6,7-dimethyl-8-ribityllumazine synthase